KKSRMGKKSSKSFIGVLGEWRPAVGKGEGAFGSPAAKICLLHTISGGEGRSVARVTHLPAHIQPAGGKPFVKVRRTLMKVSRTHMAFSAQNPIRDGHHRVFGKNPQAS
ncbi:MAG TPA: hypothetical protein PLY96_13125, partial [Chromatiaceae bacterium]|nr:hypothetical protein [Chromatiaceae bacterium]